MKHFKYSEFQDCPSALIDWDLLRSLDILRELWGYPIIVSPASGAVGREIESGDRGFGSYHNILKHGKTKAIDVFPTIRGGSPTIKEMRIFYSSAKCCLFNGIGLYSDTTLNGKDLHYMVHLDVREEPLGWHRKKGKYIYGQEGVDSFFNNNGG